ncbi:hypothetical protein [Alcanivorax hongdengensis]|nr:hypothetical protein [Alcanivorax hongdengensis]
MDDFLEAIIRGFGRALGYLLLNLLFECVFYYLGWPVVKVLTLGRYPSASHQQGWKTGNHQGMWVSGVGLLVFVLAGMLAFHLAGF